MLKNLKQGIFPLIIAFSALSVSASAAFYSISGLSKLFAGASFEVIIMASSLEISKLVIASLLYQYWDTINKILRTYLMVATVILILITSMGIYGFLSAAYQETANKAGNIDAQVSLVEVKRDNVKEQLTVYTLEKENITKAIADLRAGLANNVIQYKDKDGNLITSTSSATRNALEKQLDQAIGRQTDVNLKVDELNTQLFEYETEIVEIQTGSNLAGELGPLKFLSGLTGIAMDKIINVLLLVIIFVFDPLAISLVIAANFAFAQINPIKAPEVEEQPQEEQQYDPLDLNRDGIVDENERAIAKQQIEELETRLRNPLSSWRIKKLTNQIDSLKSKIGKEDETKTY
ncbi:MAG: hypothetical protein ACO239_07960 [Sediminibacterium sp.]